MFSEMKTVLTGHCNRRVILKRLKRFLTFVFVGRHKNGGGVDMHISNSTPGAFFSHLADSAIWTQGLVTLLNWLKKKSQVTFIFPERNTPRPDERLSKLIVFFIFIY